MPAMSLNSTFFVGGIGRDGKVASREINAKFLLDCSGNPIVDPVPRGSQDWNIYLNGETIPGPIANPSYCLDRSRVVITAIVEPTGAAAFSRADSLCVLCHLHTCHMDYGG